LVIGSARRVRLLLSRSAVVGSAAISALIDRSYHLRGIAANDERPRTMHVAAQQTDRELLPNTIRRVLDRHDQRLISRAGVWRKQNAAARDFRAAYERIGAAMPSADRGRCVEGLEL
jgi:hypothetical protein